MTTPTPSLGLPELAGRLQVDRAPLKSVVCELRFPLLLVLLKGSPPDRFQQTVLSSYPRTALGRSVAMSVGPGVTSDPAASPTQWMFSDRDDHWTVTLSPHSLALEVKQGYRDFQDFHDRFRPLVAALLACYPIPHAERLGLRYINELSIPGDLPVGEWVAGLQPMYRSSLQTGLGDRCPASSFHQVQFRLENDRNLIVRYGYSGSEGPVPKAFSLDFDAFQTGILGLDTLDGMARDLNETLARVFYWSVQEPLRTLMGFRLEEG